MLQMIRFFLPRDHLRRSRDFEETKKHQPRSQGLSSLPPLVVGKRLREAEKREVNEKLLKVSMNIKKCTNVSGRALHLCRKAQWAQWAFLHR